MKLSQLIVRDLLWLVLACVIAASFHYSLQVTPEDRYRKALETYVMELDVHRRLIDVHKLLVEARDKENMQEHASLLDEQAKRTHYAKALVDEANRNRLKK